MRASFNETPTNYRNYYTSMREAFDSRYKTAVDGLERYLCEEAILYQDVKADAEMYKKEFNIDLNKYEEFVNNKYSTGKFNRYISSMFIKGDGEYEIKPELYTLKKLSDYMKKLYEIEKEIQICQKVMALNMRQYAEILRVYYQEVHKKMILDGCGYALPGRCGWLVINRFKFENRRPTIDYNKTRKREMALRAAGKKIYNKEEAEWCKIHGIDYKAEDKRVFQELDYGCEIVILGSMLPNSHNWKFTPSSWMHRSTWKKTYDDFLKMTNNDTTKICELPINIRAKLQLCLRADNILHTKFIRNETQKPAISRKIDRKDRQ